MTPRLEAGLRGIGVWAPGLPDWPSLRACLRGEAEPTPEGASAQPPAQMLSAGERRRAPLSVRLAIEAGAQAVAMAGLDAGDLQTFFVCSHGDVEIVDYMCHTLAEAPQDLSPTRFHNSVHNAAAGYWTIAAGCHAASSAATGFAEGFGAGLLEAAVQCVADLRPVLLVSSDLPGAGALEEVIPTTAPFGCALLLTPQHAEGALAHLRFSLDADATPSPPQGPCASALARHNHSARGMPLFEALAAGTGTRVVLPAGSGLGLVIEMEIDA